MTALAWLDPFAPGTPWHFKRDPAPLPALVEAVTRGPEVEVTYTVKTATGRTTLEGTMPLDTWLRALQPAAEPMGEVP